jgi:tripartite-type tricarboxylate transporter receptor subunit TctC
MFMRFTNVMLAAGATVLIAATASAQTYPTKPIRVIVPFTPGSSTDITARAVGDRLTAALGQPFLIENRAGAGGRVGAEVVAKSAPDGYTLLVNSSAHTVNPAMYKDMPFNTADDFAGITPLANLPNVLIIAPSKNISTVKALVDYAKANPGKLNFASAGAGSATHMNAEKFSARAGIKHTHIPYRGTPEAITDVMAGRADVYFAPLNTAIEYIKDNRVLALAIGTARRSAQLPNVPTTIEAGVPDSAYNFWVGMFAPAKTPRDIVEKLNAETVKVLQSAEITQRFQSLGAAAMPMKPAEFDAYIKAELVSIAEVVKAADIKIQ